MPNPRRGEIAATLDGRPFTLVLTLGALAELEAAFGHSDMVALAERFETGRISARDAVRIIGTGLRAAGHTVTDDEVAHMPMTAAEAVAIVAELLAATFTEPTALQRQPTAAIPAPNQKADGPVPFPGPRS
jgi:hypothetical protein